MPADDAVVAALAWADEDRVLNDPTHTHTLAAAVRALQASVKSAAVGLGQSRVDRIAELEERDKTLTAFANAALEHQRQAESALAAFACSECGWHHAVDCPHKAELDALKGRTCRWTVDEDGTPHAGCNKDSGWPGTFCPYCGAKAVWAGKEGA